MYHTENSNKKLLYLVNEKRMATDFPDIRDALKNPNGLLAIGGTLTEERLLTAYKKGIFGAPTFIVKDKIFWGQDRLQYAVAEAVK